MAALVVRLVGSHMDDPAKKRSEKKAVIIPAAIGAGTGYLAGSDEHPGKSAIAGGLGGIAGGAAGGMVSGAIIERMLRKAMAGGSMRGAVLAGVLPLLTSAGGGALGGHLVKKKYE